MFGLQLLQSGRIPNSAGLRARLHGQSRPLVRPAWFGGADGDVPQTDGGQPQNSCFLSDPLTILFVGLCCLGFKSWFPNERVPCVLSRFEVWAPNFRYAMGAHELPEKGT